jgi:hypothetical protein
MPPKGLHIALPVAKWFLAASFVNCHTVSDAAEEKQDKKRYLAVSGFDFVD